MKASYVNGMGYHALVTAFMVKAGMDVTLTDKQWRRTAKRLHKQGIRTNAAYWWYEVA